MQECSLYCFQGPLVRCTTKFQPKKDPHLIQFRTFVIIKHGFNDLGWNLFLQTTNKMLNFWSQRKFTLSFYDFLILFLTRFISFAGFSLTSYILQKLWRPVVTGKGHEGHCNLVAMKITQSTCSYENILIHNQLVAMKISHQLVAMKSPNQIYYFKRNLTWLSFDLKTVCCALTNQDIGTDKNGDNFSKLLAW